MVPIFIIFSVIATALLGGNNLFFRSSSQPIISPESSSEASCKATLDSSRLLKLDVSSNLESIYKNDSGVGGDKEKKTWVLVKENAPIPAWKAELLIKGTRGGKPFAEMEKIGTSQSVSGNNNPDADGKEVYIGTGWCDTQTGTGISGDENQARDYACVDPLVQDVVYVVTKKGATLDKLSTFEETDCDGVHKAWILCWDWGQDQTLTPEHTQQNVDDYWWTFNVYYDASKLPADPTYEDLPEWMKLQCPDGGDPWGENRCRADPTCNASMAMKSSSLALADNLDSAILGAATTGDPVCDGTAGSPCLIISKSQMNLGSTPVTIADSYISSGQLSAKPTDPPYKSIGTAYNNHFTVYLRQGSIAGTDGDHYLVLDPIGHDGPWYTYSPILSTSKPQGNTLQLGSFSPGIPSFFYEWWTPACKPAIYLYPEKETEISVKVKPEGFITKSIPEYGENGWNIIAEPNGIIKPITDNRQLLTKYPYLYYEASIKNVTVPKDRGWTRKREELPSFFAATLPKLGLNEKEQKDFLDYWIPKLQEGENWYITLIDRKELDRVEPIEFSKQPDNFIRIRFYFEKLDEKNNSKFSLFLLTPNAYNLTPRTGFTAVDWGGILGNGSCGIDEKSQ